MINRVLLATTLACVLGSTAMAQEHPPAKPVAEAAPAKGIGPSDILLPHLTDSKHLEYPCFRGWADHKGPEGELEAAWGCELQLPVWKVAGIDFGPTKHTVWLFISAVVVAFVLIRTAAKHKQHTAAHGHPKGAAAAVEYMILYLRNEVYMPALGGHGGEKYVPFCLTLFFFIL